jgi:hypothetical protein
LAAWAGDDPFGTTVFWSDLDGDGKLEAIAILEGSAWCETGGCTLVVADRGVDGWNIVSHTPAVRPPVEKLPGASAGWRDLSVLEVGGGIAVPRRVLLRFRPTPGSVAAGGYVKQPEATSTGGGQVLIP